MRAARALSRALNPVSLWQAPQHDSLAPVVRSLGTSTRHRLPSRLPGVGREVAGLTAWRQPVNERHDCVAR
jgi:hypothetical protein